MKQRAMKAKDDYSFWSSTKRREGYSKTNDIINYYLQKWIISHAHVIQYTITND